MIGSVLAWLRQRAAYVAPAALAVVGAVVLGATGLRLFEVDGWLWLAIWLGLAGFGFLLTRRSDFHYRGIWLVLVGALLILFAQNYMQYRSIQDRLTQLHGDFTRQAADVLALNLANRFRAQALFNDMQEWLSANDETRSVHEGKVTLDLTVLEGSVIEADTRLKRLLTQVEAAARSDGADATQPESALRRAMLGPALSLAADSSQATAATVNAFQSVHTAWPPNRSIANSQALIGTVNPGLYLAIDNVTTPVSSLKQAVSDATAVPVGDVVLVILILNLTVVLFPWLLVLLFIAGRRDVRLRQIYMDLWDLGGQSNKLLVRILEMTDESKLTKRGYMDDEVKRELQDRTFSDSEYLLCLGMLTLVVAGAWHLIIFPNGELGLVELFANNVSVGNFVTYVVSNLNVVTLGFLGAYFYSVGVLIRRFFATDLYPAAYLQMIYRLVIVLVISLVLTVLVGVGSSLSAATDAAKSTVGLPGGKTLEAQIAIAGTLAFGFGVFTGRFLPFLRAVMSNLPLVGSRQGKPDEDDLHVLVSQLEGVDMWVASRLNEESIETVQAMAGASIERLVRRTYFSTAHIVSWVDQALLYMHAGNGGQWMPAFRATGIHKATDLLRAIGYGAALSQTAPPADAIVRQPVDLASVQKAVDTIVQATANVGGDDAAKLTPQIVFEIGNAVWGEPNLPYIVNFYNANKIELGGPPPPPPQAEGTIVNVVDGLPPAPPVRVGSAL